MPASSDDKLYPASGLGDEMPYSGDLTPIPAKGASDPVALAAAYVAARLAAPYFPTSHRAAPSARVVVRLVQKDPHDLWVRPISVHWAIWDTLAPQLESGALSKASTNLTAALEVGDIGYIIARAEKMVRDLKSPFGDPEPAGDPAAPSREPGWSAKWDGGFNED
jgi:hypothetical protein